MTAGGGSTNAGTDASRPNLTKATHGHTVGIPPTPECIVVATTNTEKPYAGRTMEATEG